MSEHGLVYVVKHKSNGTFIIPARQARLGSTSTPPLSNVCHIQKNRHIPRGRNQTF